MWVRQILMAVIGLSAGVLVAGGLFGFIVELGVISVFADRTHTGDKIHLYEDCTALGGIIGNLVYLYRIPIPYGRWLLLPAGLLIGIFVGCWAMALAEILNVFPIFIRRLKITRYIAALVCGMALGRGVGALVYFYFMH